LKKEKEAGMNKIFYFTSTGNSLYVAKEIQKRIGGEIISIPKALKEGRLEFSGDNIGIIYPCYELYAPSIVREFIEKSNIKGKYIFSIMSYGNMPLGGVEIFRRFCKQNGLNINYGNELSMVNNYLPMFDIDQQLDELDEKKIPENLNKIIDEVYREVEFIKESGLVAKFASSHAYKFFEGSRGKTPNKFKIEESCTKCEVCVKVCPVSNIKMVEGKLEFSDRCIACFACTHNCPTNSIRFSSEKSKTRFRNENIDLKEIIDSNNQWG
jgi:ferredoxin